MRIGYLRWLTALLLMLVLVFCGIPAGGDEDDEDAGDKERDEQKAEADREARMAELAGMDPKVIDAAVKKAVAFLKGKQQSDGSWTAGTPTGGQASTMRREMGFHEGLSALCLLALLKAGVDANDECIKKGFNYLHQQWTGRNRKWSDGTGNYDASVLILALAARYNPHVQNKKKKKPDITKKRGLTEVYEPEEKKQARAFKKAPPAIKDWMRAAVAFIVSKQTKAGGWAYPASPIGEWTDSSNTQYAMLALHAARTVGLSVPKATFVRVADYFLGLQEKDGPDVKPFIVPAADFPIKQLKKLEKALLEQEKENTKQQLEKGVKPGKIEKWGTGVIENPYEKFGVEGGHKMKARGWGYMRGGALPADVPATSIFYKTIGSMTTSGVAAMVIAKANIENSAWFKKRKKACNQSIRDGCAWLAHHFTVTGNAECSEWHMYYLYGLERAGVLSIVIKLGEHNWYKEGAEYLLGSQSGDGSWAGETGEEKRFGNIRSPAANLTSTTTTCFAVLFLKRATAAVVKLPGPIWTGGDYLGGNKKDDK
ncbi:MAG: hypothetical protein E3J72_04275 [Planctomycetota bacterium]|nr:MAG: hypothetical protein E3J72_04275 [Planctomycetota bacterium]